MFAPLLLLAVAAVQEPAPEIPPLLDAGNSAYMKGDYETARQSFLQAWDLAQQKPPSDPVRYDVLKRLTSVRNAAGDFADADNFLQMAINWRENVFGQNDARVAEDLLISVSLSRGLKNYDRALLILSRVTGIHRIAYGADSTAVADDFSRMGAIFLEQKNLPAAIAALNSALEMRTKIAGPMDPSLVPDLDRLAGTHIAMRAYDKAEAAYRHALVIRETVYGKDDPDLIASADGLAYALFGQKKYDDAEPLYQRLIGLWVKSLGDDHPMVAIALDKVAVFYADQKKFDRSKEATERANAIRTHFLASGLSAAATEQLAENNKPDALTLYRRALLVMDPPHPLYQEMHDQIREILKNQEAPPPKLPVQRVPVKKK